MIKTKIIATLGPSVDDEKILTELLLSNVNIVRLNMSHGRHEIHRQRIKMVRQIAKKQGLEVGILIDLQGPKIRIGSFKKNKIYLKRQQNFILDTSLPENAGDINQVGIDYYNLPKDLLPKDILLLDDGRIVLEVQYITSGAIHCIVCIGGELSNNKGINRQGGGLSASALTEKDLEDLEFACQIKANFLAISFPKTAKDIIIAKKALGQHIKNIDIIAKIERSEAIQNLDDMIKASDAIMVARGDLGVEIGFAAIPSLQKKIIEKSRELNRPVIIATQMMESMIKRPIPTRAEVSDIANAVIDGTDAVMLSAETAVGQYPVRTVASMAEICIAAEAHRSINYQQNFGYIQSNRVDKAIAISAMFAANQFKIQAIVSLTETGATTLWMSRINSDVPIYGLSRNHHARAHMTLYKGVHPIDFDLTRFHRWEVMQEVLSFLKEQRFLNTDDRVIVTRGDISGIEGRSNSIKIMTVK